MAITHSVTSAKSDGGDATVVRPSNWNADHVITSYSVVNSTTAQGISVYNTYTDASNYERGVFDWTTNANVLTIGTQEAGTGSVRDIKICTPDSQDIIYFDAATPLIRITTPIMRIDDAGGTRINIQGNKVFITNGTVLGFDTGVTASADVGIGRNAAGVLEVNSGTAGTLRDIKARDITLTVSASVTPASNGELVIQATSNTSLTFKYKGSDGTVRSASLTLT